MAIGCIFGWLFNLKKSQQSVNHTPPQSVSFDVSPQEFRYGRSHVHELQRTPYRPHAEPRGLRPRPRMGD